jgi:predicted ArsR family transcriptional regulator
MRVVDDEEGFDRQVGRIAALAEPIRRALYRYVSTEPGPVGREQAASAVGVAPHVAKFHLDKLEADGLLDSEYSRPPGRSGPGAGRPAKRYRRAKREVSVSLPERRYDLAGRVMAQAIDAAESGTPLADALHEAAAEAGRRLGDRAIARLGRRRSLAAFGQAINGVLSDFGYEPRTGDDDAVTLANCPFHALVQEHTDLVCGINLDLIDALLETCGGSGMQARLDPAPDRCCVTLVRRQRAGTGEGSAQT